MIIVDILIAVALLLLAAVLAANFFSGKTPTIKIHIIREEKIPAEPNAVDATPEQDKVEDTFRGMVESFNSYMRGDDLDGSK